MGAPSGTGSRASHEAASASSPKASIPSARDAFLCKLISMDFDTRIVTLRAWNTTPALKSGFYVVVPQSEWTQLRDRAASAIEARSDETRSGSAEGESAGPKDDAHA